MPGELHQGSVVDDVTGLRPIIGATLRHLAIDHGSHAVVEDFGRCATQGLECGGVAAQHRLHVLLRHEPAPQHTAMSQHEGEQPDDTVDAGLISEHGAEISEVDLCLSAGWCLEPNFEPGGRTRPDGPQEDLERGITASEAEIAQLTV